MSDETKNLSDGVRQHVIFVRLTSDELGLIDKFCQTLNISRSEFVRRRLFHFDKTFQKWIR